VTLIRVDWIGVRAADHLMQRALELRAEAARCLEGGYTHWSYEFAALAGIAERASAAERRDPPDPMHPCGVCHGIIRCDIDYHRSLG
jgi:hypothetical protein